jgi:CRP/FNR family transcriptional regulator
MLEEHGRIKNYKDREVIFKEGDRGQEMFLVRSGKVKIERSSKEKPVTLATLGIGEFFGEMALFGDHMRSATAQAVGDTELSIVDKETFMSFIKDPVIWTVIERMSERIREVDDKLEALIVQDDLRKDHIASLLANRSTY